MADTATKTPARTRRTTKSTGDKDTQPTEAQDTQPTEAQDTQPTQVEAPRGPRNVVEAIVAVMRDVTYVGKDGVNTQSNYNFRGIDGTVNALGPAMRRHGLVMFPGEVLSYDRGDVLVGRNNTKMGHVGVKMRFKFAHSNDDGELSYLTVESPGEAMDSGDKATAKAMSVALRTALLQSFMLPTHQPDPDEETHERSQGQPEQYVPTDEDLVGMVYSAFQEGGAKGTDRPLRDLLTTVEQNGASDRVITAPDPAAGKGATKKIALGEYVKEGIKTLNARLAAAAPREGDGSESAQDAPPPAEHAREQADTQDQGAQPKPGQDVPPTRSAQSQDMIRGALLDEIGGQAFVIGETVETLLGGAAESDVPTTKLREIAFGRREQVAGVLREQGDEAGADAYDAARAAARIAPWDVLTGAQQTAR